LLADRLDPVIIPMFVDKRHHYFGRRSSSAWAKKAEKFELSVDQIRDLMAGKIDKFSLPELVSIARKIDITVKV